MKDKYKPSKRRENDPYSFISEIPTMSKKEFDKTLRKFREEYIFSIFQRGKEKPAPFVEDRKIIIPHCPSSCYGVDDFVARVDTIGGLRYNKRTYEKGFKKYKIGFGEGEIRAGKSSGLNVRISFTTPKGIQPRKKIVNGNLRLILSTYKNFGNRKREIGLDEYFSNGCISLDNAVDKYIPGKWQFSTYAVRCIINGFKKLENKFDQLAGEERYELGHGYADDQDLADYELHRKEYPRVYPTVEEILGITRGKDRIILLGRLKEKTLQQIGEEVGLSYASVHQRLAKIFEKVRKQWPEQDE